MSGPNINRAGVIADDKGIQDAKYHVDGFEAAIKMDCRAYYEFPCAYPTSDAATAYASYAWKPSTNTSTAIHDFQGYSRSGVKRFLKISLNDLYARPLMLPYGSSASSPSSSFKGPALPIGVDLWDTKYQYYRVTKRTVNFDIQHVGGYHGDTVMPVSFLAYHYNNDVIGGPTDPFADNVGAPYAIMNNSTRTVQQRQDCYVRMQSNPRIMVINDGRCIGPSFAYGFGTEDATFTHSYGNRCRWSYTFDSAEQADDPTKTTLTPNWTLVRNGGTSTPPSITQELHLFMVNELPTYSFRAEDTQYTPLDVRITIETEVEFRDIPGYSYFYTSIPNTL